MGKLKYLLLLVFLLLFSCKSTKEYIEKEHHEVNATVDSIRIVQEKTIKAVTTPRTTTVVTVSREELNSLPVGASFQTKQGNASGEVRKTKENEFEFTATCDSLTILVQELKTEVHHLNSQNSALKTQLNEQKTAEVNKLTGWQSFQIWLGRVCVVLLIIYILYKRFFK